MASLKTEPLVTRSFVVPVEITVDADHPEIALQEVDRILEKIATDDRHLKVSARVPNRFDPVPTFTLPDA